MDFTATQYFNGQTARPQNVNIIVVDEIIQIIDLNDLEIIKTVYIRDCEVSFTAGKMYVYFSKNKTSYLTLEPSHPMYPKIKQESEKYKIGWFNNLIRMRGVPLVAILVVLFIGIYYLFINLIPWIGLRVISEKKEITMGKQFYNSYIKDVDIDSAATLTAQYYANQLQLSNSFPITVTVVKDDIVNAFALPGGHIIVYSGIIKKIHSSDEFAALLGHESTHINERHGMRSLLRSVSSSILFSLILNDGGNVSGVLLRNADQLRGLSYSRSLEEKADQKGMQIMLINHLDPQGMKNLMEDLSKANSDVPESLSFISTHPLTKERIASANKFLKAHLIESYPRPVLDSLWQKLKAN